VIGTGFNAHEVTGMLGMTASRLRAYVRAGLLSPQRGHDGELLFSFQDLLLLRTAEGLVTERLPPRRVRAALCRLRRILPASQPLTGVQLANASGHVVVRDGERAWRADSGQVLMPFEGATLEGGGDWGGEGEPPIALRPPAASPAAVARGGALGDDAAAGRGEAALTTTDDGDEIAPPVAEDFFQLGCSLEAGAPEAARAAYERALALGPTHVDAHVNLGRLLHEAHELRLAEEHYRAALALQSSDVTALFNLGVLMEDQQKAEESLSLYEEATRLDPNHADAHFNAARLHDLAGHYEAALRHLRAYRNLTAG
jgi:tetratricopeptide (TPR) repeat protein